MDNIEKQVIGIKSHNSDIILKKSPAKSNYVTVTPVTSPVKNDKVLKNTSGNLKVIPANSSPNKFNSLASNSSSQTLLLPHSIEKTSVSPNKCKKEISSNNIESPEIKLDFSDDDKTTDKKRFKRKTSPTKTPENKKFKVNSSPSYSNTQVSNINYI